MTGNDAVEIKFLMEQIANSQSLMNEIEKQENLVTYLSNKQESYHKRGLVNVKNVLLIAVWISLANIIAGTIFQKNPSAIVIALVEIFIVGLPIALVVLFKNKAKSTQREVNKECETLANMKNDSTLNWLPFNYRDSFSYKFIAQYIHNGRAYNLKEAINLLETEQHQARMELLAAMGRLSQ